MAMIVIAAIATAIEVGFTVYQLLNRPKIRPPVQDLQISSSIDGNPIPFGYGTARVAGALTWTPGLKYLTHDEGGSGGGVTVFTYYANFQFSFCEGPAGIKRLWGDSKLIYDAAPGVADFPIEDFPAWDAGTIYNIGDIIGYAGQVYTCEQENTGITPGQPASDTGGILYWQILGSYAPWDSTKQYSPGDVVSYGGQLYVNIAAGGFHTPTNTDHWNFLQQYYGVPIIYPGNETQLPDPTMQASEGADNTPAERGICKAVFTNFPLSNFGNRIPSVRAEVNFSGINQIVVRVPIQSYASAIGVDFTNSRAIAVNFVTNPTSVSIYTLTPQGQTLVQASIVAPPSGARNYTINSKVTVDALGNYYLFDSWHSFSNNPVNLYKFAPTSLDDPISPAAYIDIYGGNINIPNTQSNVPLAETSWRQSGNDYLAWNSDIGAANPGIHLGVINTSLMDNAGSTAGRVGYYDNAGYRCNGDGNGEPIVDPATGKIYLIANKNDGSGDWAVIRINPFGGVDGNLQFTDVAVFDVAVGGAGQAGTIAFLDTVRGQLIIFYNDASAQKFDIATETFGATYPGPFFPTFGGTDTDIYGVGVWAFAQNGLVHGGKILLPDPSSPWDGGTQTESILHFVDANTLADVGAPIDLSSIVGGLPIWGGLNIDYGNIAYDPVRNYLVANVENDDVNNYIIPLDPTTHDLPSGARVAAIVRDVCIRSGMLDADIDVSQLNQDTLHPDDLCLGYLITRQTTGAEVIKALMQAFFFDGCESDGLLKWIPRGLPASGTIPEEDLGLLEDGAKVGFDVYQEQDIPGTVTVIYNDISKDYQQGKQIKARSSRVIQTKQQEVLELPMTMDRDRGRQIAEKTLWIRWHDRDNKALNLWKALYMKHDPTDVLEYIYKGRTLTFRVVETTLGQGFSVTLTGPDEDSRNYISDVFGASGSGFRPAELLITAPTTLALFDLPLLRDTDAAPGSGGFYWAPLSAVKTFQGATLFRGSDGANFSRLADGAKQASFGYAIGSLGAPASPDTWDLVNTLQIRMVYGQLAGASEINVLNGANPLVYGDEVIQYQNAVLNDDGTYTISKLLRGRRGTEWACGAHDDDELVVDPLSGLMHQNDALALTNQVRHYKAASVGQDIAQVPSQQFTNTSRDLMPYSPVQIAGDRDLSNNVTLSWVRRTRFGGDWLSGPGSAEVPLNEEFESYDVEIYLSSVLVRTISERTSPTTVYSAADQISDGITPGDPIDVVVYQRSATVGRGFPGSATV